MTHLRAKLSRLHIEVGASLTISGSQLFTGDTLEVALSDDTACQVRVSAFGMARLTVTTDNGVAELGPWNASDDPLPQMDGPVSTWTVRNFKEAN